MRNLKLYTVIKTGPDSSVFDEIAPPILETTLELYRRQNDAVIPINAKALLETGALEKTGPAEHLNRMQFIDWVLAARQRNNPRHVMFYNIDANPDHRRHTFGDRYDRAFRFGIDNVMDVFKVIQQLNEAAPRHVLHSIYPPQALSEAFNLPETDLTDEMVYFQLIPSIISLS